MDSFEKENQELRMMLEEVLQGWSLAAASLESGQAVWIWKRINGIRERMKWLEYGNVQ